MFALKPFIEFEIVKTALVLIKLSIGKHNFGAKMKIVFFVLMVNAAARGFNVLEERNVISQNGLGQSKYLNETVLSRKRRFLTPLLSGWILNVRLTLLEPLSTPFGSTFTQLIAFLPFTFRLDSVL